MTHITEKAIYFFPLERVHNHEDQAPIAVPAHCSATCGPASCHPHTSPFRTLLHPQSLYIHPSAQFADVHGGMLFESRYDAIFDVLPAGWPPYLFALRLRLAGNGRLFDNNLHSDEFDSLGDAIAHEFAARGPTEFLLLGLRLARSGRRASSGPARRAKERST